MTALEDALREHVRREEAAADRNADSLWDHLLRTAAIAEQLGRAEGLDPGLCRLAALFHDAGKFHRGQRHGDGQPEEVHSVAVLRELGGEHGLAREETDAIADAILQLYRDDPTPTPLGAVLFDADNLDKLGHLGVANFFVKRGLLGRGVSPALMVDFTVELTYARHAEAAMHTAAGRARARRRAPQTRAFFVALLDQLRDDGLADLVINEVDVDGLVVDAVVPPACRCGRPLTPGSWQEEGLKCTKIHLVHACASCGDRHEVRFCRPRLVAAEEPNRPRRTRGTV